MLKGMLPRGRLLLACVLLLSLLVGGLLAFGMEEDSDEQGGLRRLSSDSLLFQSAGHHSGTSYVERMAGSGRTTLKLDLGGAG